jgi:NAD(P)H dehydrogenase (quinone)
MQDINVLVTFCSRTGSAERLALKAAVGAVQARANIRLRWLREAADDQTVDSVPAWRENRDRMEKEYVAPREADFLWAEAMVIAIPANAGAFSTELDTHLESMKVLQSGGKLHAKVGTAITAGSTAGQNDPALDSLYSALAGLNLILVPQGHAPAGGELESARLQGRRVTEVTRALKQADETRKATPSS